MNTQAAVPLNVKENVNYESVLKRTPEKKIMSLHRAMRANYKNIFYPFYEQLYNAWQVEIKNKGLIWW